MINYLDTKNYCDIEIINWWVILLLGYHLLDTSYTIK